MNVLNFNVVATVTDPSSGTMGTATPHVVEAPASLVVDLGQPVTLTYTIDGAVAAWIMTPTGRVDVNPTSGTFVYHPTISGPFPMFAQDAAGGIVVEPLSIIVRENLPAIDPAAPFTHTSVADGRWDDPATWGGTIPTRDSIAHVGHNITAGGRACQCGGVVVDGHLSVIGGVLYCSEMEVSKNGALTIDGSTSAGKSLIMLRNRPKHPSDASDFWRVAWIKGAMNILGTSVTQKVRTTAAPMAGQTVLHLESPASGWKAGNKLLVADSHQMTDAEVAATPYPWQGEIAIVRGVSADGLTVYLLHPLVHDHPSITDKAGRVHLPHVAHLIRSAGFVTSDPTDLPTRGYVRISDTATVDCQHGLLHGLGRTTLLSADDHCSVIFDDSFAGQGSLTNCVILDPFPVVPVPQAKWGVSLRDVGVHLQDNVVFNWIGAGIMLRGGGAGVDVVEGNFTSLIDGTREKANSPAYPIGTAGAGIWSSSLRPIIRNNVASGCGNYGMILYAMADNTLSLADDMRGNEFYGCRSGFTYWYLNANVQQVFDGPGSTIRDMTVWNCYASIGIYESHRLTFDTLRCVRTWRGEISYGFSCGDYLTSDLLIVNSHFEGTMHGIDFCSLAGAFDGSGGTQTIRDSFVQAAQYAYLLYAFYHNSGSTLHFPARRVLIDNVRVDSPNLIYTDFRSAPIRNLRTLDEIKVRSCNGVPGDDFEMFRPEQAASAVMLHSSDGVVASEDSGQTNQWNWDHHGYATMGRVAPVGAHSRAGIANGLVFP